MTYFHATFSNTIYFSLTIVLTDWFARKNLRQHSCIYKVKMTQLYFHLLDRINTKVIFNETKILSVNQINAQTKLLEVWKSQHDEAYPLKWATREETIKRIGLKSSNKPELIIEGQSKLQTQCFINDAARIWNLAPMTIKECNSISAAKKYIKTFVKTLPI